MDKWIISSIISGMIENEERLASSNLRDNNNNDDDDYDYSECDYNNDTDYSVIIEFMRR